jgi:aspartate/methionine/tyrosine aminotransferase
MQLDTFALERFQSVWENRVPWNLSESGVHPLTVAELLETADARDALLQTLLGYPQTNGTAELRQAIAAAYPGASAEHVEVTNGGSEANCVLLMRLLQPGDEFVFMTPNYMQGRGLARALGATVREWRLQENTRDGEPCWTADVAALDALVTERTRAIMICNPANPTGTRLDEATLDAVCRAAGRVGAWVIADEIYRGAERDAADTPSIWGRYDRAIVSSGLSKAYGLPGLRIGWIVGPPTLVDELWAVHDYTTIAPGAINDRLARVALAPGRRERLLARTRGIVRANYPLIRRWIGEQDGLSHAAPDAGAIVFVKYAHPVGSVELAERLRTDAGVLVLPGTFFDLDGYLRIGFGADPAYLSSALDRIGDVLRTIGAHAR